MPAALILFEALTSSHLEGGLATEMVGMPGILHHAACVLCKDPFKVRDLRAIQGQRIPLLLSCGHAACHSCIRSVAAEKKNQKIVCGICGKPTPFSGDLKAAFPYHSYLVGHYLVQAKESVIQEPKSQFLPGKPKVKPKSLGVCCGECESTRAVYSCVQCAIPFCEECFTSVHQTARTLRGHVKEDIRVADTRSVLMCVKHPRTDLDIFCESCETLICMKCSIMAHRDHNYISTSEKNEQMVPSLKEALERAVQLRLRRKASHKEALGLMAETDCGRGGAAVVAAAVPSAERELAQHLVALHGRLQLREAELAARVASYCAENEHALRDVEQELESGLAALEAAMATAHVALLPENVAAANIVSVKGRLDDAMRLNARSCLIRGDPSLKLKVSEGLEDLLSGGLDVEVSGGSAFLLTTEEELPPSYVLPPLAGDDFDFLDQNKELGAEAPNDEGKDNGRGASPRLRTQSSSSSLSSHSSSNYVPAGMPLRIPSKSPKALGIPDPVQGLTVGSTITIVVTHTASPTHFYVQLTSSQSDLTNLSDLLTKEADKSEEAASIQIDKYYMVKYTDDNWYRGCIIKKVDSVDCEQLYEVLFIDYGNTSTLKPSLIKNLPKVYASIPSQAILCGLYHVVPPHKQWTDSAMQMFCKITIDTPMKMHVLDVASNGKFLVDLSYDSSNSSSLVSLRDAMIFCGEANFIDGEEPTWIDSSQRTYVEPAGLLKGIKYTVELSHVNSPSDVFVQLVSHDQLGTIMPEIQTYCCDKGNGSILNPSVGMPCLALFSDSKWYRAVIIKVLKPKRLRVRYVDYGNEDTVFWDHVKHIPERFMQLPIQAIRCSFADVAPVDGKLDYSKELLKQFASDSLELLAVSQDGDKYNVVVFLRDEKTDICINGFLVKNGVAKSTGPNSLISEHLRDGDDLLNAEREYLDFVTNGKVNFSNNNKDHHIPSLECESSGTNEDRLVTEYSEVIRSLPSIKGFSAKSNVSQENTLTSVSMHSSTDQLDTPTGENTLIQDDSRSTVSAVNVVDDLGNDSGNSRSGPKRSVQERLRLAQANKNEPSVPSKYPVKVLVAESPSCIYVQLRSTKLQDGLARLKSEMNVYYEDGGLNEESAMWTPSIKSQCAVKSGDSWYRGLVMERLPDDEFRVILKDLGKVEVIKRSAMRKLSPLFLKVSDGAIKCHLANVKVAGGSSTEWSTMSKELLQTLIEKNKSNLYIAKMGQIENRSLPVELWVKDSVSSALQATRDRWFTVNRRLVDEGLVLPINMQAMSLMEDTFITEKDMNILSVDDPDETYLEDSTCSECSSEDDQSLTTSTHIKDWQPAEPFEDGEFLGMPTYVDHDCFVYLHDLAKSNCILRKINKRLNKKFRNSRPGPEDSYWFENNLCAVQYHLDKKWYRGKVKSVSVDNSVSVQLVDYGNIEECRSVELRKDVFFIGNRHPVVARKCKISQLHPVSDDDKWTIPVLDFIHHTLVDKKCKVKVIRKPVSDDDVYEVDIHVIGRGSIRDILVERGLATYFPGEQVVLPEAPSDEEPDILVLEEIELLPSELASKAESTTLNPTNGLRITEASSHDQTAVQFTSHVPSLQMASNAVSYSDPISNSSNSSEEFPDLSAPEHGPSVVVGVVSQESGTLVESSDGVYETDAPIVKNGEFLLQNFRPQIVPKSDVWLVTVAALLSCTEVIVHVTSVPAEPELDYWSSFRDMFSEMQDKAVAEPPLTKSDPGSPCCYISSDGLWYRGLIESVNGDEFSVKQVDGGTVECVSNKSLRNIPCKWLEEPILGIECKLNCKISQASKTEEVCEKMAACLFGQELVAKVLDRNPLRVELSSSMPAGSEAVPIYQALIDEGLMLKMS